MFKLNASGFQIVLENGYKVSVQFGPDCYSDSKSTPTGKFTLQSSNAEIAVFDPDGKWVPLRSEDNVLGWQSVTEVLHIIDWISK